MKIIIIIIIIIINMTTYNYKDLILVENYYKKPKIVIEKIDIYKIYKSKHIFDNINNLKFSDLKEYFPLLKLFKLKKEEWKNYKYEFNITNLSPKDLNVDIKTINFIQNQFMRYYIKKWNYIKFSKTKILLFLVLLDFLSKTVDISNKEILNILIKKLEPEKNKILNLGIIDKNILDNLLQLNKLNN